MYQFKKGVHVASAIKVPFTNRWIWLRTGSIRRARKKVRREPNNAEAHYCLAKALLENFDVGKALSQSRPGEVLSRKGLNREAIYELREVIRLNPLHFEARLDLCCILSDEGKTQEQIKECTDALRLLPPDEETRLHRQLVFWNSYLHYLLGCAFYDTGKIDSARKEWNHAVSLGSSPGEYAARQMLERYSDE